VILELQRFQQESKLQIFKQFIILKESLQNTVLLKVSWLTLHKTLILKY